MLFDTDVLIWIQRGNQKAADLLQGDEARSVSVLTYMELLQGATDKRQHAYVIDFIRGFDVRVLPLSENVGHRAAIYVEEYALSHGLRTGDAIVAATAAEGGLTLCTGNAKHFMSIREMKLRIFKP